MPTSKYSMDTDRTTDVQTQDQTPFGSIIDHHPTLLQGLADCGFTSASPIQVAAIPTIIAGNDTIVEAKNGTGKTLTFVIPTLFRLKLNQSVLQTIILAPTREIAVQIQQCFKKVGQHMPDMKCEYFIGGTPVEVDKQKAAGCQIAVGSPGRIKHLLNEHVLKGSEVKSFILDEVDRLFTDKNFTKDVRLINAKLPKLKQIIVVSASIDKSDMSLFDEFMKEYSVVNGAEEDMNAMEDPSKFLLGIKQYVACVKAVSTNIILLPAKNVRLLNILQNLPYTQCIIFTNYMTRVEAVCNLLRDHNYKADYIRGDQDQNIRLKLVDRLTSFQSRILVATDLIARGIDSSNVDLVINMDCPNDWATYLHRIGRAGRFGNKGSAFTILDDDKELKSFKQIINSIESVKIKILPIAIKKTISDYSDNELEDLILTNESDIVTEQDKNNLKETVVDSITNKNKPEDHKQSDSELKLIDNESNTSNSLVECVPENKTKSFIYGPGISEEESLKKLCQVVKETEKKLIDNHLINKKHLTADRTFVLFDPFTVLDDTEQYEKYSPQELADIITKYDSDFEKYEAAKKQTIKRTHQEESCKEEELTTNNQKCLECDCSDQSNIINDKLHYHCSPQNNSCDELLSTDKVYSADKLLNNSNSSDDTNINSSTNQQPRFTNIYDLFQIPDFSLLAQTQCDNVNNHSTIVSNENSIDEEYDEFTKCVNVQEEEFEEFNSSFEEEEEDFDNEVEEDLDGEDEEDEDLDYVDEEDEDEVEEDNDDKIKHETFSVKCNKFQQNVVSKHVQRNNSRQQKVVKYSDKIMKKSVYKNVQKKNHTSHKVDAIENNNQQQLVDYDLLNNWYGLWKHQLSIIQTCVKMSK